MRNTAICLLVLLLLLGFWFLKNLNFPAFQENIFISQNLKTKVNMDSISQLADSKAKEQDNNSLPESFHSSGLPNDELLENSIDSARKELIDSEIGFCTVKTSLACVSSIDAIFYQGPNLLSDKKWDTILSNVDKQWNVSSVYDFEDVGPKLYREGVAVSLDEEINVTKGNNEVAKFKLLDNVVDDEGQGVLPKGSEFSAKTSLENLESQTPVKCLAERSKCEENSFTSASEPEILEVMSPERYINYLIRREQLENYIKAPRENGSDMYDKAWYDKKLQSLLEK